MKKNKRRKMTQEQVDAINRKRDLIEGTNLSFEHPHKRLRLDENGRPVEVDVITDMRW
jgi:hypothetical protein